MHNYVEIHQLRRLVFDNYNVPIVSIVLKEGQLVMFTWFWMSWFVYLSKHSANKQRVVLLCLLLCLDRQYLTVSTWRCLTSPSRRCLSWSLGYLSSTSPVRCCSKTQDSTRRSERMLRWAGVSVCTGSYLVSSLVRDIPLSSGSHFYIIITLFTCMERLFQRI